LDAITVLIVLNNIAALLELPASNSIVTSDEVGEELTRAVPIASLRTSIEST
jgi:hypothetical protein